MVIVSNSKKNKGEGTFEIWTYARLNNNTSNSIVIIISSKRNKMDEQEVARAHMFVFPRLKKKVNSADNFQCCAEEGTREGARAVAPQGK